MKCCVHEKILEINGKKIEFEYPIEEMVEFEGICIVLLIGDIFPKHNVIAFGSDGNMLWNIADVIKLGGAEAYVGLWKINDRHVWVRAISGMETTFDVYTKEIIEKILNK